MHFINTESKKLKCLDKKKLAEMEIIGFRLNRSWKSIESQIRQEMHFLLSQGRYPHIEEAFNLVKQDWDNDLKRLESEFIEELGVD